MGEGAAVGKDTAYLEDAVRAFQTVLSIWTESAHSLQWALTQEDLGEVHNTMADRVPAAASTHLDAAQTAFDAALRIFDPTYSAYYFERCTAARARVAAKLAALPSGQAG